MEQLTCRNCGTEFSTQFCGQCGQERSKKLSFVRVAQDVYSSLFNFDSPFLVSMWRLSTNPGEVYREYIEGKRKTYFSPIRYSLWLLTLLVGVASFMEVPLINLAQTMQADEIPEEAVNKMQLLINSTFASMYFITALILACVVRLFFRKDKYTIAELYLPMLMGSAHASLVAIPFLLLGRFHEQMTINILTLVSVLYMAWGVSKLYRPTTWKKTIKAGLAILVGNLLFTFLLGFVVAFVIISQMEAAG